MQVLDRSVVSYPQLFQKFLQPCLLTVLRNVLGGEEVGANMILTSLIAGSSSPAGVHPSSESIPCTAGSSAPP